MPWTFLEEVPQDGANPYTAQPIKLPWGKKTGEAFCHSVLGVADNLGWSVDLAGCLMASMAFESGCTFSPSIKNAAGSGATGLIQFMPATARGLGTTVEALAQMSAIEQLEWVEKYFRPYSSRIHTLPDMYMAILLPKYVSAPSSSVLFSGDTIAYRQNAGLDADSDGKITKYEASEKVRSMLIEGMRPENAAIIMPS